MQFNPLIIRLCVYAFYKVTVDVYMRYINCELSTVEWFFDKNKILVLKLNVDQVTPKIIEYHNILLYIVIAGIIIIIISSYN